MGTGVLSILFSIAKLLLPIITQWISEAQRAGIVKEGEQKVLGAQALALAKELGAWDDIKTKTDNMSDADLDDLVTGRVRPPQPGGQGGAGG